MTTRAVKATILSSVHLALDNRVFYREARTLARAGYDVTLIAVHDRDEVIDGVRIRALPRVPRSRRPLLWRRLTQMALESDADIYHIHDPELLLITPYLRRKSGRPTLYDIHEANADFIAVKDYLPGLIRGPLSTFFRRLEPVLARGENGLIFADDAIASDFEHVKAPKVTLFNFPGAELTALGDTCPPPNPDSPPVLLYLGGMERNRGSALLVTAFAEVLAQRPDARLLVVGHFMPPSLEDEIRADAEARNVSHAITMTGRVPFGEIGDYLAQSTIGWVTWQPFTKNQKNVPTKLFEYMAFGRPVISSDLPSTRPFVEQAVNGFLVRPDDPHAHASAILKLIEDPQAAIALGQAGKQMVNQRFNWGVMAPRLLALYEEVLSSP
jgi:glycosyltransferase involved in cell wall biosynthesis